ncbi:hypothetical protein ACJX0J_008873, partial [Zea mays]
MDGVLLNHPWIFDILFSRSTSDECYTMYLATEYHHTLQPSLVIYREYTFLAFQREASNLHADRVA